MPLSPANGCALMQSAFGVLPDGTKFADAAEQGPRRDFGLHEAGGKRDRRPLPRPLWQNEAKKPRSLKRLQPGADGNREKLARPNHRAPPSPWVLRPISGSACASPASMKSRRSARSLWISAPPSGGSWVLRTLSIFDRREVALVSPRPVRGRGAIHL